jgi:hypothetical protein
MIQIIHMLPNKPQYIRSVTETYKHKPVHHLIFKKRSKTLYGRIIFSRVGGVRDLQAGFGLND